MANITFKSQFNEFATGQYGTVLDAFNQKNLGLAKTRINTPAFQEAMMDRNDLVNELLLKFLGYGDVRFVQDLLSGQEKASANLFKTSLHSMVDSENNLVMSHVFSNGLNSDKEYAQLVGILAKALNDAGKTVLLLNGPISVQYDYQYPPAEGKTPLEWALCPNETTDLLYQTAIALIAHGARTTQPIDKYPACGETLHDYLFYHPHIPWRDDDQGYLHFLRDWFDADMKYHANDPYKKFSQHPYSDFYTRWERAFHRVVNDNISYLEGAPGRVSFVSRLSMTAQFLDKKFGGQGFAKSLPRTGDRQSRR